MNTPNITRLSTIDPENIYVLICDSHPQIISVILSLLPANLSSSIMGLFMSQRLKNDVALRMVTMGMVNKFWLYELDKAIGELLDGVGDNLLVKIPEPFDLFREIADSELENILMDMREYDPELTRMINEKINK